MKCSMDHSVPTPPTDPHPGEYPVGLCSDLDCGYPEPHRHGFDCDKTCACKSVGPETAPLADDSIGECDWGHCDRESVAIRWCRCSLVWLTVCSWHAGWDDYESEAES